MGIRTKFIKFCKESMGLLLAGLAPISLVLIFFSFLFLGICGFPFSVYWAFFFPDGLA